jgi:predicted house-cleaning noncanonical NTP pyrophosphatase (MazG superfamily)
MEKQLLFKYSMQALVHAINIYNFPEDYPNIKHRILSIRYLLMYYKECPRICPTKGEILEYAEQLFNNRIANRDTTDLNEIADIVNEHGDNDRLLNRIREYQQPKIAIKTVYNDSQNVHNTTINQSVIRIAKNLYSKYGKQFHNKEDVFMENIKNILIQTFPEDLEIILESIEYLRENFATFGINITLQQVFICLWLWISEDKYKEQLQVRLLEELKEMKGQCTTGHLARLINVIQGFTEDEKLLIKISNTDQINSVVRQYLNTSLINCKDERVIEGMIEHNEHFIIFVKVKIRDKLPEWIKEYGKEILFTIPDIINNFVGKVILTK